MTSRVRTRRQNTTAALPSSQQLSHCYPYHVTANNQSNADSLHDARVTFSTLHQRQSPPEISNCDVVVGGYRCLGNAIADKQVSVMSSSENMTSQYTMTSLRNDRFWQQPIYGWLQSSAALPTCVVQLPDGDDEMTLRTRHHVMSASFDIPDSSTCAVCLLPMRRVDAHDEKRHSVDGIAQTQPMTSHCCPSTDDKVGENVDDVMFVDRDEVRRWWSSMPRSLSRDRNIACDYSAAGGLSGGLNPAAWRRCRSASDLLRLILVTSQPPYEDHPRRQQQRKRDQPKQVRACPLDGGADYRLRRCCHGDVKTTSRAKDNGLSTAGGGSRNVTGSDLISTAM